MKIVFKLSTTVFTLTCRTLYDKKIIPFNLYTYSAVYKKSSFLHYYFHLVR